MRLLVVLALLSVEVPSSVRADSIGISTGFCPPGLDHGVRRHSDACTPRPCTSDAECGTGAACHEIAECWTRESTDSLDGRVLLPEPVMIDVVQGLCGPDRSCVRGLCATRRQCEPTSSSPAWDAAGQRWTGTFLDSEPGHGCNVGHARASRPFWTMIGALVAIAIALRRVRGC